MNKITTYPLAPEPDGSLGPAMLALASDRQRAFVRAMIETGGNATHAEHARMAGFLGDRNTLTATGCRLANDPAVQAAIVEEGAKLMHTGVILATSHLLHLCKNAREEKDQLKAINMLLNRVGLHEKTEHKLTVRHEQSEAQMIREITALAQTLGIDAQKLIGNTKIIDGEFKEVKQEPEPEAPEEDWG